MNAKDFKITALGSDVRIYVSDVTGIDYGDGTDTVNVYISLPLDVAPIVWSMADYLKPGTFYTKGSGSRIAAKFGSVDANDVPHFVRQFRHRLSN